ncbi:MAG: hypothetical protein M3R08_07760, partial [Bacteroidota bacterium]|nr:hypothetical protein [Bacteroidota bacterium]
MDLTLEQMNYSKTLSWLLPIFGCVAAPNSNGQVTTDMNQGASTDFVGWDLNQNFPLTIRHDAGNQPIQFHSTGFTTTPNMFLSPTITGFSFNGYNTLDLSGHLGIGIGHILPTNPPKTYLHLNGSPGLLTEGYRNWMRVGLFNTTSNDGMYVGLKRESSNNVDAIFNWGDDYGQYNYDALRFIFTASRGSGSVAQSEAGLEIARLIPSLDGNVGYFGIGDFNTASTEPTERLDVLNGRLRIRELPLAGNEADAEYLMMVVDNSTDPDESGVVKWVNPATALTDCEWTMNTGTDLDLSTAFGTSATCPDENDAVGIGVDLSTGFTPRKLHVKATHHGTAAFFDTPSPIGFGDIYGAFIGVSGNGTSSGQISHTGLDINSQGTSTW